MAGLPAREELILKSIVRMLDKQTHHQWFYTVANPMIQVMGIDLPASQEARPVSAAAAPIPCLRVGHSQQQHDFFLHLPMHANEVEFMLNKLGAHLARQIVVRPMAIATVNPAISDDEGFILLRWPPAALLHSPARLKMATSMRGRLSSASLLLKRSGATGEECAAFLRDLKHAGLVRMLGDAPSTADKIEARVVVALPDTVKVGSSLMMRIRSRLGLTVPVTGRA